MLGLFVKTQGKRRRVAITLGQGELDTTWPCCGPRSARSWRGRVVYCHESVGGSCVERPTSLRCRRRGLSLRLLESEGPTMSEMSEGES